ncbi:Bodo-specific multi-copy gene family, putative [Bodo saltans]|uniref:Bodo-specific multi-copy gene family, putative n=1 Tax=Bodo saltans TaxID=75058 RepID=A0A0S4JPW1_BODSA|nr:Bodo-specific multi-copy gene family, putative [Bodo saltans]|eukprot:CUG92543.1 Bodo-specific multi-copy gene family, putative [Bodo saltans]
MLRQWFHNMSGKLTKSTSLAPLRPVDSPTASDEQFTKLPRVRNDEATLVRWLCRQGISTVVRHVKPTSAVSRGIKALASKIRGTAKNANDTAVKCYNAASSDIEFLLRNKPLSQPLTPEHDDVSLTTLLSNNGIASLTVLLREFVDPPFMKLTRVTTTSPPSLLEDDNNDKLRTHLDQTVLALAPKPGCELRNVAALSAPQDSRNKIIKKFVSQERLDALKYGRVIVRCCKKAARKKEFSWCKQVLVDRASPWTETSARSSHSVDAGLCELIRTHVELVTSYPQDPSHYCDPQTAYATWMKETARCFRIAEETVTMQPLIILNSCEVLARENHKHLVHRSSGKPYTLLEAFCLSVPSPYSIFVSGTNIVLNETMDSTFATMAAVTNIR